MRLEPITPDGLGSDLLRRGIALVDRLVPGPERLGAPMPAPRDADPVVLVGGFGTDAGFWDVWRRSLEADGFRVYVFDDPAFGLGSVRDAARGLAARVDEVRAATGARKVDVLTYSAGCAVARAWLSLDGGARRVDSLVAVDGSWRGDDDSRLLGRLGAIPLVGGRLVHSVPPAFFDLQRTSALYAALATKPSVPRGVRVTAVYPTHAATDDVIEGARNVPLADDPGHLAVLRRSTSAYEAARAALLATTRS
jgi:pimeloyl-ACP methyl ester carboxylesterase